jgi:hypothetical protein
MVLADLTNFIKANRDKGRGEAFAWDDDELQVYIHWADTFQYLFVELDENGFAGVAVMYPVAKRQEQTADNLMTFKDIIPVSGEKFNDLCVMDFIATTPEAKKSLVIQLKERYPNWQNQDKWALRFGNIKKLSNNYINLLNI